MVVNPKAPRAEIDALERIGAVLAQHTGEDLDHPIAEGLLTTADEVRWLRMVDELRASGELDRIKADVRAKSSGEAE